MSETFDIDLVAHSIASMILAAHSTMRSFFVINPVCGVRIVMGRSVGVPGMEAAWSRIHTRGKNLLKQLLVTEFSWLRSSVCSLVSGTTASGKLAPEQVDDEVNLVDTQPTSELVALDVREQSRLWQSASSLPDPG